MNKNRIGVYDQLLKKKIAFTKVKKEEMFPQFSMA